MSGSVSAAARSTSEPGHECRPKSASGEIFSNRSRAARRKPAYALAASRENRRRYDEARQDRQSLQTDPVGYDDDLNLYAYVRNDPLNGSDPTGTCGVFIAQCIGAAVGAATDYGIQVAGNLAEGQDLGEAATNVDLASIGTSAVLGAVGGGAGGAGLRNLVGNLSIGTRGRIGEAATRVGIAARGERVVQTNRAAGRVGELGPLSRQATRARPDFVVRDRSGAVRVVESKFGNSQLRSSQRALQREVGNDAYRVSRTTHEQVAAVGAGTGGAATGAATNCGSGASGPCER